jgi:tetratricopeptide (TPR) repeat protein
MTLNDLAILEATENRSQEAQQSYMEALQRYRELAKHDPDTSDRYVAGTLNNFAFLYSNRNRIAESRASYGEALALYRKLYRSDPDAYAGDILRVEASPRELDKKNQRP